MFIAVRPPSTILLQVDQWLEIALVKLGKSLSEDSQTSVLAFLNAHLTLRTFFVGYALTLADIAVWAALAISSLWEKASQGRTYEHLNRYFALTNLFPRNDLFLT